MHNAAAGMQAEILAGREIPPRERNCVLVGDDDDNDEFDDDSRRDCRIDLSNDRRNLFRFRESSRGYGHGELSRASPCSPSSRRLRSVSIVDCRAGVLFSPSMLEFHRGRRLYPRWRWLIELRGLVPVVAHAILRLWVAWISAGSSV